jgi:sulfur-oxidizing protein SoxZ
MASNIKIKTKISGDLVEIKSLMIHPMETGSRKDPETGALVPQHHITQLTFTHNDQVALVANLSTAISKNPYFSYKFRGAKAGDVLKVSWVDSKGGTDELETVLK